MDQPEQRRTERLTLSIPIRVMGTDLTGEAFTERMVVYKVMPAGTWQATGRWPRSRRQNLSTGDDGNSFAGKGRMARARGVRPPPQALPRARPSSPPAKSAARFKASRFG